MISADEAKVLASNKSDKKSNSLDLLIRDSASGGGTALNVPELDQDMVITLRALGYVVFDDHNGRKVISWED